MQMYVIYKKLSAAFACICLVSPPHLLVSFSLSGCWSGCSWQWLLVQCWLKYFPLQSGWPEAARSRRQVQLITADYSQTSSHTGKLKTRRRVRETLQIQLICFIVQHWSRSRMSSALMAHFIFIPNVKIWLFFHFTCIHNPVACARDTSVWQCLLLN